MVIPEKSMEYHYPSDERLCVYRTRDTGRTWEPMSDGLPERPWTTVLREASACDAESLYFGNAERLVVRAHRRREMGRHLPPIVSVEVTEWPG